MLPLQTDAAVLSGTPPSLAAAPLKLYLDFLQFLVTLTPLDLQERRLLPPEDSGFSVREGRIHSVQEEPGLSSGLVTLEKCSWGWKVLLQQGMSAESSDT